MGIEALIQAFPVLAIESELLASLSGFLPKIADDYRQIKITFLEPPASQHVPFVDPVEAMTILFWADGMTYEDATVRAASEFANLRTELSVLERPRLFHGYEAMNIPECISVPSLVALLKGRALVSEELIEFIERACEVTCTTKIYHVEGCNNNGRWRLDELLDAPTPKEMIEYFVGTQDAIAWAISPFSSPQLPPQFLSWRESMMPVAKHLEQVLGEQVYHFQNLDNDCDDDWCHRFFVLHCWCSLLPESDLVKYMLEVSQMPDVETLKIALLTPESFRLHPFKFHCYFRGIEASTLQLPMYS